ncbi:MAG: hypothetical protein ACO21J_06355 [Anaerohalosphaeraceae bacterium]|jgi:hypothetical protein
MNWYYLLLQTIRTLFLVLLFIVPFAYSIRKGDFKKCFRVSWAIWSLVWFVYGFTLPGLAILIKKATGEYPDITGVTMLIGIMFGWLPSLVLASLGSVFHNKFVKKKSV